MEGLTNEELEKLRIVSHLDVEKLRLLVHNADIVIAVGKDYEAIGRSWKIIRAILLGFTLIAASLTAYINWPTK